MYKKGFVSGSEKVWTYLIIIFTTNFSFLNFSLLVFFSSSSASTFSSSSSSSSSSSFSCNPYISLISIFVFTIISLVDKLDLRPFFSN